MLQDFTEDKFKEWLFSLPDEEIVGTAMQNCSCPLAKFLQQLGYKAANVCPPYYTVDGTTPAKELLPDWANEIAYYVDFYLCDLTKSNWDITAKQLKEFYTGVDS